MLLFEKGKEKALQSPEWRVESVGFVGNEPLVAVSAIKMEGETEATEGWKPPLLRHLAGAGGSGGQLPPDFATKPIPKRVIEAITSSPQGLVYMLVHGEGRGSVGEA